LADFGARRANTSVMSTKFAEQFLIRYGLSKLLALGGRH